MYSITGNTGVNFWKTFKVFKNFDQFLMATELQVFVLVRVTEHFTHVSFTCTVVSVNAA